MAYKVAVFTLNQWALDFEGNTDRIIKSIEEAYEAGASYRVGPELEICGYSLEDSFYETDTTEHCWTCLEKILKSTTNMDIVIDVGMPVRLSALYNCRVICHRGTVVCIRAKTSLAREGNYREYRHFQPWPAGSNVRHMSPPKIGMLKHNPLVPIGGDLILQLRLRDSIGEPLKIGWEICQELWDIKNVSSGLYGDHGCHLVVNSSASYWELRKLETINDMIKGISLRGGACYAYSNLVGCDGQRYVMSGRSCIYDTGKLVSTVCNRDHLFDEVHMITHTIQPRKVDENRSLMGIRLELSSINQTDSKSKIVNIEIKVNPNNKSREQVEENICMDLNPKVRFEQEIHYYVPLWLWDYLRRSGMNGFIIPLSGGLDSSSVAVLIYCMCNILHQKRNSEHVQRYFAKFKISKNDDPLASPRKLCSLLLRCRYISTQYSGQATQDRARKLSQAIGADFDVVSIQDLYKNSRQLVGRETVKEIELLDQNIQARLRMALTYYMSDGARLVLATGNVDEGIMGYLTKYDCSSADINPIGGLCKSDLRSYLKYCCTDLFRDNRDLVSVLSEIMDAPPSAELTGSEQRDEDEIGITYDEISVLGKVRRGAFGCSGPSGAFRTVWLSRNSRPFNTHIRCLKSEIPLGQMAEQLSELIKRFYTRYTRNRHKLTVLTPALHAETYSPDDNRFDHRQILYPPLTEQFRAIDTMVEQIKCNGHLEQ